jgi:uncharacterized protein (TIGR03066 family)
MNALRSFSLACFAGTCLIISDVGCSSSSTSGSGSNGGGENAAKIVGKWERDEKSDKLPSGSLIEFTSDSKVVLHMEVKGKQISAAVGTYKIDGDKLTVSAKKGDKDDIETDTIKTLTDDLLVTVGSNGKETRLKKKK